MLDFNDFRYFVCIVECGGITAASRHSKIPKSTLSHRLQQLEAALGARLLNRTSRSLSMSDAGQLFFQHAVEAIRHAELAESSVLERMSEPSGTIRFTTAAATSMYALMPILPDFIRKYPRINLIQHVSDDPVDIVRGNYDVAVRAHTGPLSDSMLMQRPLVQSRWFLYASPCYLALHGAPTAPAQLAQHETLLMLRHGKTANWELTHPTLGAQTVALAPRLGSGDMVALKQAAVQGLGIVALPAYVCLGELQAGQLLPVLPEWVANEATISAVLPFRQGMLPSIRAFLDFLVERVPERVPM